MKRTRQVFPSFAPHHKLLFIPLKEFIDGLPGNITGGCKLFENQEEFRNCLRMIRDEFGGPFELGLDDITLDMANSRIWNWFNSAYRK